MKRKNRGFPRINLIPRSRQATLLAVPSFALPALIGAFLVVIAVSATRQHFELQRLKEERTAIAAAQKKASDEIAALKKKREELERKKRQANAIQQILARKISWSDFFKEMSMMIPKNIWLNEMKAGLNKEGTREMVIQGTAESPQAVSAFFQGLEQSYFFQKIMIVSSKLDPKVHPPLYRFEFRCPLEDFKDSTLTGRDPNQPTSVDDTLTNPRGKKPRRGRRAAKPAGGTRNG